jgi:hypothetical protein
MSIKYLEHFFPRLCSNHYEITSEESIRYNCIAWAAGSNNRWWWPGVGYYWPEEASDDSVESFIRVFRSKGYEICDSRGLEPDCEKIALYVKEELPTHMARQLPSGEWTSKCGELEDISHKLESLEGSSYGRVALIMKRKIRAKAQENA